MIYCVEDDSSIRDLMLYALNSAGFEAKGFCDSTDFWKEIKIVRPDLIMLDIMLPGEDGMEILKKLRKNDDTSDIPVIMATAKGTEFDKVMGLDTGADDYLVKPFGMMEMVSHIKAVLRRASRNVPVKEENLTLGNLSVDMSAHIVTVDNNRIQLTLKEYEMLVLFMKNLGRVFTREQLLEKIWEAEYMGESRTVDVHIGTLRTKLGECGEYIETVRGVGYRMEAR